jgi:glycopeptide antibiotics resistance protein
MKTIDSVSRIDHVMLGVYMISLIILLISPIEGPGFRFLGIQSDKWMHILLFGGLAVLLRWNFSRNHQAWLLAVGTALAIAIAAEIAQGLVAYRSAELWDVVAGLIGAVLGATGIGKFLSSPTLQTLLGPLIVALGLMIVALFLFADVIGVGDPRRFGWLQMTGTALGALIAMGGARVYSAGMRTAIHRD